MIKFIVAFILMFSSVAQANLGWFLGGYLLGGSGKRVEVEVKDELYLTIEQIKKDIPPVYSSISHRPSFEYNVDKSLREKIISYFSNEGYNVSIVGRNIVFNFEAQYLNYMNYQTEKARSLKSAEEAMGSFMTFAKILFIIVFAILFIASLFKSFNMVFGFILNLGPRSMIFKSLDYRGYLTKKYQERNKRLIDNWKILMRQ